MTLLLLKPYICDDVINFVLADFLLPDINEQKRKFSQVLEGLMSIFDQILVPLEERYLTPIPKNFWYTTYPQFVLRQLQREKRFRRLKTLIKQQSPSEYESITWAVVLMTVDVHPKVKNGVELKPINKRSKRKFACCTIM